MRPIIVLILILGSVLAGQMVLAAEPETPQPETPVCDDFDAGDANLGAGQDAGLEHNPSALWSGGEFCGWVGNRDWADAYVVALEPNSRIEVNLKPMHAEANVNVALMIADEYGDPVPVAQSSLEGDAWDNVSYNTTDRIAILIRIGHDVSGCTLFIPEQEGHYYFEVRGLDEQLVEERVAEDETMSAENWLALVAIALLGCSVLVARRFF